MKKHVFTSILLLALSASPAMAVPMTWDFTGEVTGSFAPFSDFAADPFPVGAPVTYSLTFDPDWWADWSCSTNPTQCDLRHNENGARLNFAANIAGYEYNYSLGPIHGSWNAATRELGLETTLSAASVVGDTVTGVSHTWYPIGLNLFVHLPIGSGPAAPSDGFRLYLDRIEHSTASTAHAAGRMTSVHVPTPSSLLLMALGLAGMASRSLCPSIRWSRRS
jgi:hypothetical protein